MKIHELKTLPEFYTDVFEGRKKFEMRINDRDYNCGDVLHLREYVPETSLTAAYYTGNECLVKVTYILSSELFNALPSHYIVMSIDLIN
jgi:Domain of unknown function (DUF3850)